MSEEEKLKEEKKDSYVDNPQDACDRQDSFQAISDIHLTPTQSIPKIAINSVQSVECFRILRGQSDCRDIKLISNICEKESRLNNKKKHSKFGKNTKGIILCKRFCIRKLIDSGTHGQVFEGIDIHSNNQIAIKIMPEEVQIIKRLNEKSNNFGFSQLVYKGKSKKYNFYVMIKLGNSLKFMGSIIHKFTLENTLMISLQLLSRLKILHSLEYVHRDIKPANLLFGTNEHLDVLHIIDFGLTKKLSRFKGEEVPSFIFEKENVSLSGTPNYASVNLHCGWEECFKSDDIESMVYLLIYLLRGCLPWENLRTDDNYYTIMKCKQTISSEELCFGLPSQIKEIVEYVRSMKVYDEPDYQFIEDKIIEISEKMKKKTSSGGNSSQIESNFIQMKIEMKQNRFKIKSNSSDVKLNEIECFKSPLIIASKHNKEECKDGKKECLKLTCRNLKRSACSEYSKNNI